MPKLPEYTGKFFIDMIMFKLWCMTKHKKKRDSYLNFEKPGEILS